MECNISRRILELDIACSELKRMDNMISKADRCRITDIDNRKIYIKLGAKAPNFCYLTMVSYIRFYPSFPARNIAVGPSAPPITEAFTALLPSRISEASDSGSLSGCGAYS